MHICIANVQDNSIGKAWGGAKGWMERGKTEKIEDICNIAINKVKFLQDYQVPISR